MRPFDWQRDLHPSMWNRLAFTRASWWTPRRMGIVTVVYSLAFALLLGYVLGAR